MWFLDLNQIWLFPTTSINSEQTFISIWNEVEWPPTYWSTFTESTHWYLKCWHLYNAPKWTASTKSNRLSIWCFKKFNALRSSKRRNLHSICQFILLRDRRWYIRGDALSLGLSSNVIPSVRTQLSWNDLTARSIAVHTAIIAQADSRIDHKWNILKADKHLPSIPPINHRTLYWIELDVCGVPTMTRSLSQIVQISLGWILPYDIGIELNRRLDMNTATIFGCTLHSKLYHLYQICIIGCVFNVQWRVSQRVRARDDASDRLFRCWLRFGVDHQLRFLSESLL